MISALVFSKNRALQLDLLLNSIKKNFKQCSEVSVLYTTTDKHKKSYEILQKEHGDIKFVKQGSFYSDICDITKNFKNKSVVMFTDDDIVYRDTNIHPDFLQQIQNYNFACFSLRLGPNITKRQVGTVFVDEKSPLFGVYYDSLMWNRTEFLPFHYFGYPLSVDGHIFAKNKLVDFFAYIEHSDKKYNYLETPNKLETLLQRFFFEVGPIMICNRHSSVVNSPNNRVQEEYQNRAGDKYSYCEDHLMEIYMQGTRIKLESLDFSHVNCPHTEIKLL